MKRKQPVQGQSSLDFFVKQRKPRDESMDSPSLEEPERQNDPTPSIAQTTSSDELISFDNEVESSDVLPAPSSSTPINQVFVFYR